MRTDDFMREMKRAEAKGISNEERYYFFDISFWTIALAAVVIFAGVFPYNEFMWKVVQFVLKMF